MNPSDLFEGIARQRVAPGLSTLRYRCRDCGAEFYQDTDGGGSVDILAHAEEHEDMHTRAALLRGRP